MEDDSSMEEFLQKDCKKRVWKPCKPKFDRSVMLADNTTKTIELFKNIGSEEDNTEFENELQQRKKNKEIIKNALNIANKIAFNSHKNRFEDKTIIYHDATPGPGYYNTPNSKPTRNKAAMQVASQPEDRARWTAMDGETTKLGPGFYYENSTWIRPSYNITMPNNVIYKRKEQIIQSRLDRSIND